MSTLNELLGNDFITAWLVDFIHADVAKMTLAFAIAAWFHRGWVKKDMKEQFGLLRESIDHVADAMGKRMDGLDRRVDHLEDKINE